MNPTSNRTARRALASLIVAAALIAPAPAGAATYAWVSSGTLYVLGGSEASDVKVSRVGSNVIVADPTRDLHAGWFCTDGGTPAEVTCPAGSLTGLEASLGDGNDRFASRVGLPAKVNGGAGDDVLLTRNELADTIICGAGIDSGEVDTADSLSLDCEDGVERPVLPPAPAPVVDPPPAPIAPPVPEPAPQPTPDEPEPAQAPVSITAPSAIRLSPKGEMTIKVGCTADSGSCRGGVELIESGGSLKARPLVGSARSRRAVILARSNFTIPAGGKKSVRLRLDRRGRQRIIKKKKKKRKTRAKLVVTVTAPDGTKSKTTKSITISPPKERRSSSRGRRTSNKARAAR